MNAFLKCSVATLSGLGVLVVLSACHPTPPPPLAGGPIHGYVAAEIIGVQDNATTAVGRVRLINVPDVEVWAQSTTTSVVSAKVKTNAAGYFHTPVVPHGQYHMCTHGPGYLNHCESQVVTVAGTEVLLDHTVLISPTPRAVAGTVWFLDKKTACFWYRPAFDVNAVMQAKVSLVDGGGNVVAGPVNGNSLGEYVLPVTVSPGAYKVNATCSGSSGDSGVALTTLSQNADVLVANHPPHIDALDLTKGAHGVRRADPGDLLHAKVTAVDPDGDTLHYQWTDDSGRSLGLPDSATVDWPLMATPSLNKLHVQVSDGKGGFDVSSRNLFGGPNEILFAGSVFDRFTGSPVKDAQVVLNQVPVQTDARGEFAVKVPDAPRFVLNISKTGYALSSRVYYGRNTGMKIPLDPSNAQTVNAGSGGTLEFPCERKRESTNGKDTCQKGITMKLAGGVLVDKNGNTFSGTATMEAFQYDTSLPNPIPGDQGGTFGGKTVRLSTYGAFYLQPRDGAGNPLQMAPGKKVDVSMPIEGPLLGGAPANIPFFRYDEDTGMWKELGKLTRSGGRYVGQVDHFSAFNADTQFAGSACLKVILDDSFTLPVNLDASYVDTSAGTFHHNNTVITDNPVGIERMPPNQNFTLEVHDGSTNALLKSVTLLSGPALDPVKYPDGAVTDPNFTDCNGPVTVYNSANLPTGPTYLMPILGGSITDNSAPYRTATNADPGGNRDTFDHWKAVNNFPTGEASAIYFNNGDLKFGRSMHCRVGTGGVIACYVSNFGVVGTDDEATALSDARDPTKSPVATVAMEYDPAATPDLSVQFWAYKGDGSYLAAAALDGQGAKPLPDICLACHNGFYDGGSHKASGASFLPFDVASFHYDTAGDPHTGSPNAAAVQEQFRQLNKMVLDTTGSSNHAGYQQLMNLWYPGGVGTAGQIFSFTRGAAQLSGTPFSGHEPLYDNVVAPVCRTCHITHTTFDNWTSFGQMQALSTTIKSYACGPSSPATQTTFNFAMPHAEVPFKKFWNDSLSSTLDNQLSLSGCPNH
jgi:hypothetical protein